MLSLSVRCDTSGLEQRLQNLVKKQIPFATARALTGVAKKVQQAERDNMKAVLDRPRPFTLQGVAITPATKNKLTATVDVKPITAAYLEPYQFGGQNKLNGRALLKPINMTLDQFGNIPRKKLTQLKARSDIFIGKIKTKNGMVNGVWQRPTAPKKNGKKRAVKGANTTGKFLLLIRFTDAHPVRQNLGYFSLAEKIITANFGKEFQKALQDALATSR
jgi:hypothetical protein